MRRVFLFLFIFSIFLTSFAHANLITNASFENSTGVTSSTVISIGTTSALPTPVEIFGNQTYTVGSNEGVWVDRRQWVRAQGVDYFNPDAPSGYSGNYFAYHAYQGGSHTDLLSQGFSVSTYGIGDTFNLSFEYILADLVAGNTLGPGTASVYVLGFGTGGYLQGVSAAWMYKFDSTSTAQNFETYVASNTENVLVKATLGSGNGWQPFSDSFILDKDYEALALIFKFNAISIDGFQGVDNVNMTASVPEPTSMLLLGLGLVGLAGVRRKFKK